MVGYEDSCDGGRVDYRAEGSQLCVLRVWVPHCFCWVKPVCYRNIEVRGCGAHELVSLLVLAQLPMQCDVDHCKYWRSFCRVHLLRLKRLFPRNFHGFFVERLACTAWPICTSSS